MKVKTNIRAGRQNRGGSETETTDTSSSINNTVVTYVAPVSRCTGI